MAPTPITRQTSTTFPLHGELSRAAPAPRTLATRTYWGPLVWALEGRGWEVLRPVADFALLAVAVIAAVGGVGAVEHVSSRAAPLLALPPIVTLLFYLRGLYRTRLRALLLDGIVPVLTAVSVGAMTVITLGLFANHTPPPQGTFLRTWVYALVAVGAGRVVLAVAQRWARSLGVVGKPVLIMGAGVVGAQVARRLECHPEYGLAPVGFLDDEPRSIAEVGGRDLPVLGTTEDLEQTVSRTGVKRLIVAFSSVTDARMSRLIQHCQTIGVEVSVVPRMFDTINNRVGYDTVGGMPLMSFELVDPRGKQFAFKHTLDRLFAALLLAVLSPVMLLTALAVALTSRGPVLFNQRRVGRDGKVFDVYKFRSMREDFDEHELAEDAAGAAPGAGPADFQLDGDLAPGGVEGVDRRTLVGRFIRRWSIDELPQLFNVLRGEMSIIGPRPERPEFVELFGHDIVRYDDRHRVKSGITGWAQVHGLRGKTSLDERVEWDNYYIAHWSLALDVKILVLTFIAVFHRAE